MPHRKRVRLHTARKVTHCPPRLRSTPSRETETKNNKICDAVVMSHGSHIVSHSSQVIGHKPALVTICQSPVVLTDLGKGDLHAEVHTQHSHSGLSDAHARRSTHTKKERTCQGPFAIAPRCMPGKTVNVCMHGTGHEAMHQKGAHKHHSPLLAPWLM